MHKPSYEPNGVLDFLLQNSPTTKAEMKGFGLFNFIKQVNVHSTCWRAYFWFGFCNAVSLVASITLH
jgi:hypothetical protein